jgi:hypothetical protein
MHDNYILYKKRNQELLQWAEESERWYGKDDMTSIHLSIKFI